MCDIKDDTFQRQHQLYGMVELSRTSETIIRKVTMFKRLQKIGQLGELAFKRPYANHTRFQHSIGVAYLARVTALHLQSLYPQITNAEVLCVELAGLLHDIGHGAFSHGFDRVLKKVAQNVVNGKHEQRSQHIAAVILGKNPYDTRFKAILPDELHAYIPLVQYFIDPTSVISMRLIAEKRVPKFTPGLEQIVNNTICKIDTDKFEYIPHDCMMLRDPGLDVDVIAMIKRTRIINGVWSFDVCDYNNIFNMLSKRSTLHSNFYQEKDMSVIVSYIDSIMETYINHKKIVDCLSLDTKETWTQFQDLTDENIISFILNTKDAKLAECRHLMETLCTQQDMPKVLYETADAKYMPPDQTDRKMICVPVVVASDDSSVTNVMGSITWHQNGDVTRPSRVVIYRFIGMPTDSASQNHNGDEADPGMSSADEHCLRANASAAS